MQFKEAISGLELVGHMGPNYGDPVSPNTLAKQDTDVLYSELTQSFYTKDEFDELYSQYLSKGGKPLHGFNKQNLDIICAKLKN